MKTNSLTKFKHIVLVSSLSFIALLLPISSEAITVEDVPNPRATYGGWVSAPADILSDSTEAKLNQMIEELEAKNGAEIAVVTVPETAPASSPKAFTTQLFNYWGIGKKDVNNGLLYLISVGDRRGEIETGYGLEAILPDAKVARIIDTKIIPQLKQGDFDGGTLAGTQALVVALESEQFLSVNPQNNHKNNTWTRNLTVALVFAGVITGSIYIVCTLLTGMGFSNGDSSNDSSGSSCSRIGGSGGGYYFGGGGDFGGGRSDGGGAGGDF